MRFLPLRNLVLVDPGQETEEVVNGIIMPKMFNDNATAIEGIIVEVGPGYRDPKGNLVEMQVKVGDKVVFSANAGQEQKVNGKDFLLISENDIMGIINNN